MCVFFTNLQRITISALPQVQKLSIVLSATDPDVIIPPLSSFDCTPLNVTIRDGGGEVVIGNAAVPVGTEVTEGQIEDVLNSIEAIQSVGEVRVYVVPMTATSFEVALVFVTDSSVLPSEVPTLQLVADSGSCTEAESGGSFLLTASLATNQVLAYPDGFNLSLDSLRYTPNLPVNASSEIVEQALSQLITWKCVHRSGGGGGGGGILFQDSYEEDSRNARDDGADTPRAYCGLYSKQSPRVVWDGGSNGGGSPRYVSLF